MTYIPTKSRPNRHPVQPRETLFFFRNPNTQNHENEFIRRRNNGRASKRLRIEWKHKTSKERKPLSLGFRGIQELKENPSDPSLDSSSPWPFYPNLFHHFR